MLTYPDNVQSLRLTHTPTSALKMELLINSANHEQLNKKNLFTGREPERNSCSTFEVIGLIKSSCADAYFISKDRNEAFRRNAPAALIDLFIYFI